MGRGEIHESLIFIKKGIHGFYSPGGVKAPDLFIFSKTMDIGGDSEAFTDEDILMGIGVIAGHVVIGMVTGHQHGGHEGYVMDMLLL